MRYYMAFDARFWCLRFNVMLSYIIKYYQSNLQFARVKISIQQQRVVLHYN